MQEPRRPVGPHAERGAGSGENEGVAPYWPGPRHPRHLSDVLGSGATVSAGTWIGLLVAVMLALVAAYVLAEWRK
jgi:hypothetical protein